MRSFVVTAAPARQKTELRDRRTALKAAALPVRRRWSTRRSTAVCRAWSSAATCAASRARSKLLDTEGAPFERVLVVGLGKKGAFGRKQYRKALVAAFGALAKTGAKDAVSYLGEAVAVPDAYYDARLAAEAFGAALYRVPAIRSTRKPPEPALKAFGFAVTEASQKAPGPARAAARPCDRGRHGADARPRQPARERLHARRYLAQQARELARAYEPVRTQVLEERELKRLKMGSFLSVTNGTDEPAKLIVMRYDGGRRGPGARRARRQGRHVRQRRHFAEAAAGHGRDEVRHDRRRERVRLDQGRRPRWACKLNVVGIVPACENMPSGRATKPGDIVRSMSGQTIEVINTDAEGRLILCDALTYARRFKPAVVVDIATLTGACVVALGAHLSAVMSNDDELAGELGAAGRARRRPLLAHADGRGIPRAAEEQFRGLRQCLRPRGRRHHGGLLPGQIHRWPALGAPRHRRHGLPGGAQKGSTGRPVPLLDGLPDQPRLKSRRRP